jgi:imidazolonepropionase-like amidohydrolase
VLGLDQDKGSLAVGKDADLVLLDADEVRATFVEGRQVWQAPGPAPTDHD